MRHASRSVASAVTIIAALLTMTGCGGGTNDSVVHFEGPTHASISESTLNHWMQVLAGDDIRRNLGTEGPAGLASEPADYQRCFAAAKLVAPRSFFNQIRYDRVQITEKCHQLHQAIKAQALNFLISAHWTSIEAAERKITASAAEVRSAFNTERKQSYPTEAALHRYLGERHWSLADLLYQVRLNVLAGKLQGRAGTKAASAGGDQSVSPPLTSEQVQNSASKAICKAGYVVAGCSEYRGPPTAAPSADLLIEKLTGKHVETPAGTA